MHWWKKKRNNDWKCSCGSHFPSNFWSPKAWLPHTAHSPPEATVAFWHSQISLCAAWGAGVLLQYCALMAFSGSGMAAKSLPARQRHFSSCTHTHRHRCQGNPRPTGPGSTTVLKKHTSIHHSTKRVPLAWIFSTDMYLHNWYIPHDKTEALKSKVGWNGYSYSTLWNLYAENLTSKLPTTCTDIDKTSRTHTSCLPQSEPERGKMIYKIKSGMKREHKWPN